MARIAIVEVSSDEELPSLEDLKPRDRKVVLTNGTSKTTAVHKAGDVKGEKIKKSDEGKGLKENQEPENGETKDGLVKKKRVLVKRTDNPLLRPLKAVSEKNGISDISPEKKSRKKAGGLENNEERKLDESFGEKKRVVSRSKSTSITPAEVPMPRPVLKDENSISRKEGEKLKVNSVGDGRRNISGTSGFSSKTKNTQDGMISSKEAAISTTKPTLNTKITTKIGSKPKKKIVIESDLDGEEDGDHYNSDGLSDFIVDDLESSFLDGGESVIEIPPPPRPAPRSTRKLVQGRKKREESFEIDSDSDLGLGRLKIKDDVLTQDSKQDLKKKDLEAFAKDLSDDEDVPTKKSVPRKLFEDIRIEPPKRTTDASPKKKVESSSDIEDPFTLRYSPPPTKLRKGSKETRFVTPPTSPEPKPTGLKSPTKTFQRIPSTPHRQSMDAFWEQDVINEWNDEYSPRKPPPSPEKMLLGSPRKSPTKQEEKAFKEAKKVFNECKHDIASTFLTELDNTITSGKVSALSASTGGVKIIWSKKLNTTAGRANWKRETIRSTSNTNPTEPTKSTYRHHAAIELAEKVIDDEHKLLNVIAHEFCHLANFMINNKKDNPHGKEFKAWASLCSHHFGHRGIEVTTKHSYTIDYKFIWECSSCGVEFKRHSRSIDPKRHTCGVCKSTLVQVKPVPKITAAGEGKVNEYQVFVKENMRRVREENPGSPQKEIMGLVGKRYQEFKASRLKETVIIREEAVDEVVEVDDDEVGAVSRKLDFLDLTSP